MPYKITWNGKEGSKFSFPDPDNSKEKISLLPGQSHRCSDEPKIGKLLGLEIEDLSPKKPEEPMEISQEEKSEEKPEEKKKSKRKKKNPKKGSMGNKKIE